jgi:folate-binding protein YgfZ
MTVTTLTEEHQQAREGCVYFVLDDWCLVEAKGKDTFSFLQSQTTNDVLNLAVGAGLGNALVDRKARLLGNFSLHKTSDTSALVLVETHQRDALISQLEEYHFREDLVWNTETSFNFLVALQGPKSPVVLENLTGSVAGLHTTHDIFTANINDIETQVICKSLTGEEGYILACSADHKENLLQALHQAGESVGLVPIGAEAREILRIETGLPVYGKDMDKNHILPETGLEHTSVSYHKGCYIGQEVIARIKTYGSPAFALMGIILEGDDPPPMDATIKMKTKKIGVVKSSVYSPSLGKMIALAYLQKDFRSPDQTYEVTLNDAPARITTCLLPFYQTAGKTERAKQLHQQALTLFKSEENLDRPIALLRESIALDPKYAPGYEALGVMLSKQNKLDEAIALMKRLAEIDPQEIMAHSNLSVYYMQQGRIEDAEMEKAEATAIQFEKLVEENQAKKAREKQASQNKAEQERQVEMFHKVLEIDAVDQVANFGLGSIYLDTGKYEEALGPLKTVVEHYRDHSAAYLALGKTLEKLSRREEAAEVYKDGIEAASKKGDLMPLRDMQTRLNQILHSES